MADRSEEMIRTLSRYGENHWLALRDNAVLIVSPGSPLTVCPTAFTPADLQRAVQAGLLQKRKLTGSIDMEIYALSA